MDVGASMDVALRISLARDMVELVLGKLSFLSLIRMRLVCKSWNSLILSEVFSLSNPNPKSQLLHSLPVHEDIDFFPTAESVKFSIDCAKYQQSFIAYDTVKGVKGGWQKVFIDWPHEVLNHEDVRMPVPKLVATGGGLLCFDVSFCTDQYFVMCNPVTRKWKRLPCMELHAGLSSGTSILRRIWWRVAGLAYDENCRSYKVVVVGFCQHQDGQGWFLKGSQGYDSVTASWTFSFQDKEFTGGSEWLMKASNKSIFCNNHLYVNRLNFGGRHGVAIFSMKKGSWIQLPAIEFIDNKGPGYLVLIDNRILLLAEEPDYSRSLGLWKINIPNMEDLWNPNQPDTGNLWLKCVEQDQLPLYCALYTATCMRFSNCACVGDRNFRNFASLLFNRDMLRRSGPMLNTVLEHCLGREYSSITKNFDVENPCNFLAFEPSLSASV